LLAFFNNEKDIEDIILKSIEPGKGITAAELSKKKGFSLVVARVKLDV